jgi:3'-5' exoribonuclease
VTETPQNGPAIRTLRPGDAFTAFFVVRKKEMKTKKDGTPYLLFEFGDHTGRMSATLWEGVQAVHSAVRTGDTVKVKGSVMEYNDSLQIAVEKIRKTEPADGVDPKMFVRSEDFTTSVNWMNMNTTGDSSSIRTGAACSATWRWDRRA